MKKVAAAIEFVLESFYIGLVAFTVMFTMIVIAEFSSRWANKELLEPLLFVLLIGAILNMLFRTIRRIRRNNAA